MKKLICYSISLVVLILTACSGSTMYRGAWKGMEPNGRKVEIVFDAKKFTVTDSLGQVNTFTYTQNSVHIENGSKKYGIILDKGGSYEIYFPSSSDESRALITNELGNPMYTIGRKDYVSYEELFPI